MAKRLPPVGSGYSGRSATTGRYLSKGTAKKNPNTTVSERTRSAVSGRFVKPPKGSAGVPRAS